jgi:hypothetical protein
MSLFMSTPAEFSLCESYMGSLERREGPGLGWDFNLELADQLPSLQSPGRQCPSLAEKSVSAISAAI